MKNRDSEFYKRQIYASQCAKTVNNQARHDRIIKYNESPKLCLECGTPISYDRRFLKFCNQTCSAKYNNSNRRLSDKTKEKIRNTIISSDKHHDNVNLICNFCKSEFEVKYWRRHQKFCSQSCASKHRMSIPKNREISRQNGFKVSTYKNARSKNEIYFANLCISEFKNVLTNAAIFNKWDADVIIQDYKIAILWNGKWHYSKITAKHSVKQVQNRDDIKIKEIKNAGYVPYIIKDMGRENKKFVEQEFEKLKIYINTCP